MRNMSFMLTKKQISDRTKTVTRRLNWLKLKVGDRIQACEKCMGLGPGGKMVKLCQIEVIDIRRERLDAMLTDIFYGGDEVVKEGFSGMSPAEFVTFFCGSHQGCQPDSIVTRIEFKYVDEKDTLKEAAAVAEKVIETRSLEPIRRSA